MDYDEREYFDENSEMLFSCKNALTEAKENLEHVLQRFTLDDYFLTDDVKQALSNVNDAIDEIDGYFLKD